MIFLRLLQLEMLAGIRPSMKLSFKLRLLSRKSRPSSSGSSPWKPLSPRSSCLRKERLAKWGDIRPTNLLGGRYKAATLSRRRLQVTPCHLQKWWDAFHEAKTRWGSEVIPCLKAIRACQSVSLPRILIEKTKDTWQHRMSSNRYKVDAIFSATQCKMW